MSNKNQKINVIYSAESLSTAINVIKKRMTSYVFSRRKRAFCNRSLGDWELLYDTVRNIRNAINRRALALCLAELFITCALDRISAKYHMNMLDLNNGHEYYLWSLLNYAQKTLALISGPSDHAKELHALVEYLTHFVFSEFNENAVRQHHFSTYVQMHRFIGKIGVRNFGQPWRNNAKRVFPECAGKLIRQLQLPLLTPVKQNLESNIKKRPRRIKK